MEWILRLASTKMDSDGDEISFVERQLAIWALAAANGGHSIRGSLRQRCKLIGRNWVKTIVVFLLFSSSNSAFLRELRSQRRGVQPDQGWSALAISWGSLAGNGAFWRLVDYLGRSGTARSLLARLRCSCAQGHWPLSNRGGPTARPLRIGSKFSAQRHELRRSCSAIR